MTAAHFLLFSENGAPLGELADGSVVQPGPRIACDASAGPCQFLLDGIATRTESAAPFCPAGDTNGIPNPLNLTPGSHQLVAVAWSTGQIASARFSVVTPTP